MTKKLYLRWAPSLGLPATEEGFAALMPEQAMRFGIGGGQGIAAVFERL